MSDSVFDGAGPWVVAGGVGVTAGRHTLLDGVSFDLGPGEVVALVGPNGAGKSTMLGVIAGDREPSTGELTIGGIAPRSWKAKTIAKYRAVLGQRHEAGFAFTVEELVEMGRIPHDVSTSDSMIVESALADADVTHLRHRDTTTLSGGELARTMFARIIAQTGRLVLLDEPTAALDLKHQETVMRVAARLADAGCCVLVVLHDLNLAARYADRILMFSRGELVADGPPRDVLTENRIETVYGQPVRLLDHPASDTPLVVPL